MLIEKAQMKSLARLGYYQGRLSGMESCIISKSRSELISALLILAKSRWIK